MSIKVLEDALATTRRFQAGRFEVARTTTLTTNDSVTLRYQGEFDRSTTRLATVQTFAGSKRLLDAIAAASGSGANVDVAKSKIYTLRDDKVIYVGPSPDGTDPQTWLKYDQAALERVSPDTAVQLNELLVLVIDAVTFTKNATVEKLPRADINGKTSDVYRATVDGVSVLAELGNSLIRNLKATQLVGQITAPVPATAYIENGRLIRLTLDLSLLHADLVKLSGNVTAEAALKTTKSTTSEFTLLESSPPGSIKFTVPEPAKVRVA